MYFVCTYHLANILETPLLLPLSQLFMIIAVLAWAVTFAGLDLGRKAIAAIADFDHLGWYGYRSLTASLPPA